MDKSRIIKYSLFLFVIAGILSCSGSKRASDFVFPSPEDTRSKTINYQVKKTYSFEKEGLFASNEYDGARLNDFKAIDYKSAEAIISPENTPVNPSAYFSFKLWADVSKDVTVFIKYTDYSHRYYPKISHDGKTWSLLDTTSFEILDEGKRLAVHLKLDTNPLYLSAQEVVSSKDVMDWSNKMSMHKSVNLLNVGISKLGKELPVLDIYEGPKEKKDAIIIFCRQHPPEVTGYFALQAFLAEILNDNHLSNNFRKNFRLLVFPILNPDGVDLGHWRHSAAGVDLNRDWAEYNQPENRQIADYCVRTTKESKNDVILGLDFHSTWHDVYYTLTADMDHDINGFREMWLEGIKTQMEGYVPNDKPAGLRGPVSKGWFYQQFKAEGITYEIGDETPRPFILEKGRISAQEMMKLLVFKNED